jgi:hypothetical protein
MIAAYTLRPSQDKHGLILSEGLSNPCIVSRLSQTGARIILQRTGYLPSEFSLSVAGVERRCKLVWRMLTQAEVEFVS